MGIPQQEIRDRIMKSFGEEVARILRGERPLSADISVHAAVVILTYIHEAARERGIALDVAPSTAP